MKKLIIITAVVLVVIFGLAFLLIDQQPQPTSSNQNQVSTTGAQTQTPNTTENSANTSSGEFVELADFQSNPEKYNESKKVYFFHASWCPICRSIESEINADPSKIPDGVVLIKADFDSQTELRQKYGVTYQYTFVQVDNDGNELSQWTASSLDKVIAGIKT